MSHLEYEGVVEIDPDLGLNLGKLFYSDIKNLVFRDSQSSLVMPIINRSALSIGLWTRIFTHIHIWL